MENEQKVTLTSEEQNTLIYSGDFEVLKEHFGGLIASMMAHYHILPKETLVMKDFLMEAVEYAAHLYKRKSRAAEYQFATYYTWFAKEILDAYERGGLKEASIVHHRALSTYHGEVDA